MICFANTVIQCHHHIRVFINRDWDVCLVFFFCLQYDVINIGKDGIGAVSSSGQGSLWRVEALKGRLPDGKTGVDPKDLSLVGHQLGFRAEMLIEDTHTSIDLFRQVRVITSPLKAMAGSGGGGQQSVSLTRRTKQRRSTRTITTRYRI